MLAQKLGVLCNLNSEFPGWREHEGTWLFLLASRRLRGKHLLKRGYEECGGLAGARLRLTGDITRLKRNRQSAGLDWRAELETGVADARTHAVLQCKGVKSEVAQMVIRHRMEAAKSAYKACKMVRYAFKLALYRRDNRRTCQFRISSNYLRSRDKAATYCLKYQSASSIL
jgi:curli biogenesis system outer membrane secretion channel CsgG